MIKKQRQITNFDNNNDEQPKTNNILNNTSQIHFSNEDFELN